MLTIPERQLKTFLSILSWFLNIAFVAYLISAWVGRWQAFLLGLLFVTGLVVVMLWSLLAFIAAADVRRYRLMTLLLIYGHAIALLGLAILLWRTPNSAMVQLAGTLRLALGLNGLILALLIWFYARAEKARYALSYLSPMQFRTLAALAEVTIIGGERYVSPEEVALNVDRYLSSFTAQSKWLAKPVLIGMQLYPLLSFRPPLSYLDPEERLAFMRQRFYQNLVYRFIPPIWQTLTRGMIRMSNQLCYLGYYNDPRTFASVGYVPFSQREKKADQFKEEAAAARPRLHVYHPVDLSSDTLIGDAVVIGSGAAGSILAYGLAQTGREVLMLERGQHVDPAQFTEDEVDMFSKLYADGALQLSRDFRFQVIQGSCVGGSTVVNNAVCFDLPPHVLERWNSDSGLDAGLEPDRLWDAFKATRHFINVRRQDHQKLNRGDKYLTRGIEALGVEPGAYDVVEANVQECVGCGYCNMGCAYGKKLSMLDTVLPRTQKEFGQEALRIVAGCTVEKLHQRGRQITSLTCRLNDGRRITVKANTFVVSAGAISSSLLLLRSGLGGSQVGKHLAFNIGSPLSAVFQDVVNAYDGLQIAHYLKSANNAGFVIESWFNPPVAQALSMPGWFEHHYSNMRRYNRIAAAGVLAGTESNATVRRAGLTGREINYVPTPGDVKKLLDGLVYIGEVFLAGGAEVVMPSTLKYFEFKTVDELRRLPDLVKGDGDIFMGTGHPQGGNRLSRNPQQGVVNPEFRVHGYDNLFVCDASVFPTSIGVNPQLTIMALAHYAVPFISQSHRT